MQIPQRKTRRQPFLLLQLDRRRQLQEPEVRDIFRSEPDADEFDFRDDETVAAGMFAHVAVDLTEACEIFNATLPHFMAHAGVPTIESFDDTNDSTAAIASESLFKIVLIIGDEMGAVAGFVGTHGEVVLTIDGAAESGADFRDEEEGVDILKCGLGAGM